MDVKKIPHKRKYEECKELIDREKDEDIRLIRNFRKKNSTILNSH